MKEHLKKLVVAILVFEATCVLKKYKPKIIGITGSVGKTSTKDAVYTMLQGGGFPVQKSQKTLNTEIGVPLAILNLPNAWNNPLGWALNIFRGLLLVILPRRYPEWLVLEMGADKPGDIGWIVSWVIPDIGIITRLPDVPVHVENFVSPEQVRAEKLKLASAIREGGSLIINAEDPYAIAAPQHADIAVTTVGIDTGDVQAREVLFCYENNFPTGMQLEVVLKDESFPVLLHGVLGNQQVYPTLFAAAVGKLLGMTAAQMALAFKAHIPPPGRMRIIEGIHDSIIIDDSYNSSPVAALAALDVLEQVKTTGKRYAILGDMLELGKYTKEEHERVGRRAAQIVDCILTVGIRARFIGGEVARKKRSRKSVVDCRDAEEAGEFLREQLKTGDIVLIKGSQSGIRLERAVLKLMKYPDKKEELLVRQDREWAHR